MSVVNAFIDWSAGAPQFEIMHAMVRASDYWQPDQEQVLDAPDTPVLLSHLALFNTPQSHHEGVLRSPCGHFFISANARLDNRASLFSALLPNESPGDHMADGALILQAYQRWGEDCPRHLLGDFAFIIWDNQRQQLFCARDHMGIKVLYYSLPGNKVLVSNEHRAFVDSGQIDTELNEQWLLEQTLSLGKASMGSPFAGVHTLPAAHSLVIDRQGSRQQCYWELKTQDISQFATEHAFLAELSRRFRRAVNRRLVSAYPIGSELSEGLDSSGITGVAALTMKPEKVYTFSYSCIAENDDTRAIWGDTYQDIYAMLAMHDNLEPVWTDQPATEKMDDIVARFGSPTASNGGGFLRPELCQSKGIRTLLTGWGGDHCVTSYGDYYEDELFTRGRFVALQKLLRQKRQRGRGITPWKGWVLLTLKHLTPPLHRALIIRRYGLTSIMHQRLKNNPIKPDQLRRLGINRRAKAFINSYESASVQQRDYRELFDVGVEKRVTDSELQARAGRLEYRFPMLDVELLELAYSAPPALKSKNGMERYMYREILKGLTTERIRTRRKADVEHPKHDVQRQRQRRLEEAAAELKAHYHPGLDRYFNREKLFAPPSEFATQAQLRQYQLLMQVSAALTDGTLTLPGPA